MNNIGREFLKNVLSSPRKYLFLTNECHLGLIVMTQSSWWGRPWSGCRGRGRAGGWSAPRTCWRRTSWARYPRRGNTAWQHPERTPELHTASEISSSHPPSDCPSFRKILRNHLTEFISTSSNLRASNLDLGGKNTLMKQVFWRRYK